MTSNAIRCVPIEDQFRCQASMCHLDVFTAVRIIHATLWSWYKPHTKSARVKHAGGMETRKKKRKKKRDGKKAECIRKTRVDRSPARHSPGRRVDVKNQAYSRVVLSKGNILYSELSDFYHCSRMVDPAKLLCW